MSFLLPPPCAGAAEVFEKHAGALLAPADGALTSELPFALREIPGWTDLPVSAKRTQERVRERARQVTWRAQVVLLVLLLVSGIVVSLRPVPQGLYCPRLIVIAHTPPQNRAEN